MSFNNGDLLEVVFHGDCHRAIIKAFPVGYRFVCTDRDISPAHSPGWFYYIGDVDGDPRSGAWLHESCLRKVDDGHKPCGQSFEELMDNLKEGVTV